MKTKRNKYQYSPLNSAPHTTRLLRLLPEPGGVTHISLEEALLDDVNGQYDAISYVWGNPAPRRHVVVDGKKLQIRDNIYQCLKHLRQHRMVSKPLWIDCICINQADTAEKERQIANMTKIFSSARTVYVWLGRTSRRFQPELNPGHALLRNALDDSSRVVSLEAIVQGQDPVALAATDQLMRLVYDEYWHRLWIVQEIALASDARVVMGSMLIDAETLGAVHFTVRNASKPVYYAWLRRQNDVNFEDHGTSILDTHPILSVRNRLDEPYEKLTKLIQRYRTKLCTDPRDRIYGLLGLTSSRHCPPIDYKCSIEALLLRTMNCLTAEAEDANSQEFNETDRIILTHISWSVACVMQSLETTAGKVQSAIATSSALAQGYARYFEVMLQAYAVVLPCTQAPKDPTILEELCTSIQAPSGRIEHFWKCWFWFGRDNEKRFRMNETGVPLLICSIGFEPAFLLSIDAHQQYNSRNVPPLLSQALNTKLNTLKADWQDAFGGKFFNIRIPLAYLELVELAETWDLNATRYNPQDRNMDWRMTYEIRGEGSDVDDIAQIVRDCI